MEIRVGNELVPDEPEGADRDLIATIMRQLLSLQSRVLAQETMLMALFEVFRGKDKEFKNEVIVALHQWTKRERDPLVLAEISKLSSLLL